MKSEPSSKIQQCVKTPERFATEMKRLVGRVKKSQWEIGRLEHYFIAEHGNKYGDGVYDDIASLVGCISSRSARQYHNLYRLDLEHGNNADLQKLNISTKYEIARFFMLGDEAKKLIPLMASKAHSAMLITDVVAKEVSAIIREHDERKKTVRRGRKPSQADNAEDDSDRADRNTLFTKENVATLADVAPVLQLLTRKDAKVDDGVSQSAIRQAIVTLCDELLSYLKQAMRSDDADTFLPVIQKMGRELPKLMKKPCKSKQARGQRRKRS